MERKKHITETMSPLAKPYFVDALDMIRKSVNRRDNDWVGCPRCGYTRALGPMDETPGTCRTCDEPMEWI